MTDLREQLRDQRVQNRLAVERIRAARLQRAEKRALRQLSESISVDWVEPYAEMLDRFRNTGDPVFQGPAAYWNRRYGKDWPVFQTEQELALFRAPARVLAATNTDTISLINGISAYVIGAGYTYRVSKLDKESEFPARVVRAVQRVVDEILKRNRWRGGDAEPVESECLWRSIEDGEFILRAHPGPDGWTQFRLAEPEQLTQPPGSNYYDWLFGVCTDPVDVAEPLAYWLQYGDSPEDGEEVEPGLITHFRRNGRRGMKRGLTDLSFQTYDALQLAGHIRLSLGSTARKQASIEYVMEHASGSDEDVQAFRDAEADYQVQDPLSGQTTNVRRWRPTEGLDIPKGQRYVDGPGAPYSDKHLSILQACQRGAVSRWNGFEWLISSDAGTNNLPVDLSAESPFVRRVLKEQGRYTEAFKRPVWAAVEHYVRTCGLVVDGRGYDWEEVVREVDLLVEAPSPETRNKLEETQRAQIEIPLGLDSPQRYMQTQGRDPDQVEADNAAWAKTHPQPAANPAARPTDPPKPTVEAPAGARLESEFDENKHPRDHGKFAKADGGSGGDDKGDDTHAARQAARNERREHSRAAYNHTFAAEVHPDDAAHAAAGADPEKRAAAVKADVDRLSTIAAHARGLLAKGGASDRELAKVDKVAEKARAAAEKAGAKVQKPAAKLAAAKAELAAAEADPDEPEPEEPKAPAAELIGGVWHEPDEHGTYRPIEYPDEPAEPAEPEEPDPEPEPGDYDDPDEFREEHQAWQAQAAAHRQAQADYKTKVREFETAHKAWAAQVAAIDRGHARAHEEYEDAHDKWEQAKDAVEARNEKRAARAEKAEKAVDTAQEAYDEAHQDYADALTDAVAAVHDAVNDVDDAVGERIDDEEQADEGDPEPDEDD